MPSNHHTTDYDVAIIGGGHNGLVCACYLAKAGQKAAIFEQRSIVGGAAVTEEFHPGFRNSTASYTVSLLNPKIIADLNLKAHGLRIVERPIANFLPLPDGGYLKLGGGLERTQTAFAEFSTHDAKALPDYYAMLEGVADVFRGLLLTTPPNIGGGVGDVLGGLKLGMRMKRLPMSSRRDVLDLFTKSAAQVLDSWFENEHIKAAFAFDSIVGNYASPHTPGSAYVLLHHVFGEVNGKSGIWGHAIGGMGAITQAIAKEAISLGVDIHTDAGVSALETEQGRISHITLNSGQTVSAKKIAANINPRLLFLDLIDERALPTEFVRRMHSYRCESATFRMNVALSELPDFTCLPGSNCAEHHQSGIVIAPSMAYMDQAFMDARMYGWSKQPIVEMLIPSTLDDSLAPPNQHVASLFCQHFSYDLPAGKHWQQEREAAATTIIDTVTQYAPNFKSAILGKLALSALDLEKRFGLTRGDIFHGQLSLDQLFSNRPIMGYADYRSPIKGLYLCGSGTHPGGGVTGIPGHNSAREILKDL